ncbi:MAG: hypothetical protein K0R21_537 [Anaerocolumna sp.]|jgi:hypothetical protein|nr:hypothetical protein [Anaerocolumna sp.]
MEKNKIKIAVIDDGIHMDLLQSLRNKNVNITCLQVRNNTCISQYINSPQAINHGTICTLVLLETLETMGILDKIEVISISVIDDKKQQNLQNLCEAIRWGMDHEVNLISLSIGTKEFMTAGRMIEISKKTESNHTIIVAAGANDGSITYPACLPFVIGVKISDSVLEESIYPNPVDGIDIKAYVPELNVLKTLEQKFNYCLPATNSLLAPAVTAQVADILIQEDKILGIKEIKELLVKKRHLKIITESYGEPPLTTLQGIKNKEEIQIPVIAMEYSLAHNEEIKRLARALQQEFIKNEYSCACISDMISQNCFEKNEFILPKENIKEWLCYYAIFLNVSVIIVIADEAHINSLLSSHLVDAVVSGKEKKSDCPSYYLKSAEIDIISPDLYRWAVKLFQE